MKRTSAILVFGLFCGIGPARAELTHRYSFNETAGATAAADSVAGAGWDATLNGDANLDGHQLVLDGTFGTFAQLPAGVITNATAVTVETWATFGVQVGDWARVFDFGSTDDQGNVVSDFRIEPRAPGNYVDCFFGAPGGSAYVNHPQGLDNQTNVHLVVVLNPSAGVLAVYTNGTLISSPPNGTLPALSGLVDQLSYIGKSFYSADPYLTASIDEFRVWNQALTPAQIEASFEAGPNNVSTNAGALQRIELSLALPSLSIGLNEATTLNGFFANLTNAVNLNGSTGISYQSGNTNVLTVSSAGLIHSVSSGITTVIANYQGLSATQSVTVVPNSIMPSHRYSFNEAPGSTMAVDSIGGAAWNGTLFGNAALSGSQLLLDGSDGTYVGLPAGIIGNGKAVTVEAWASFGAQSRDWSRLFSFGNIDAQNNISEQFRLSPRAGGNWVDLNYLGADANHPQGWDYQTNLHIVAVADPTSGFLGVYANGVLIGHASNATTPLSPNPDQLSYIGRSLYPADPYLIATIDEFRVYEGALSPDRIALDTAAGPNNLVTNAGALQSATLVLDGQMK
ncbi:MAG TPA: LamG-like jellyroll fold domain-containing protein, partial [Verrucomicrobiae bacterium]|nr:LamG-like jellyroll fold domain-containing protein [Verrucomicrobiae bacterium]